MNSVSKIWFKISLISNLLCYQLQLAQLLDDRHMYRYQCQDDECYSLNPQPHLDSYPPHRVGQNSTYKYLESWRAYFLGMFVRGHNFHRGVHAHTQCLCKWSPHLHSYGRDLVQDHVGSNDHYPRSNCMRMGGWQGNPLKKFY